MARRPEKMDKERLQAILRDEVRKATGAVGGELSQNRLNAMKYYNGDPFGDEDNGSKVISTDVRDTVESLMPEFVEIFAGGDKVVEFEPQGAEDEQAAVQATDYVNYIWRSDVDGFGIIHDLIKDALLQKTGYGKAWWDQKEIKKRSVLTGLTTMQLTELGNDPTVEIIEHTEGPPPPEVMMNPEVMAGIPDGLLHDVTIIRTDNAGKVNAVCIPPEEFLRSRGATSLDDCRFLCHRYKRTVSDLIEDGYDPEVVYELAGSGDDASWLQEQQARDTEDINWPDSGDSADPAMRELMFYEICVRVDYDGDGIAEWRNVCAAGSALEILHNEEIEDHIFFDMKAIRLSHSADGLSVYDLVADIQRIKSTIWRQLLNNMYNVNNARTAISAKVNLDDYLANRIGGAVRIDTDGREALGNHIHPLTTVPIIHHAMPLLEFADVVKEKRSGVTSYNQGLDADSLNKTATGIERILGQAQKRMLLMARVMAETGFKQIFRKILKLVVNHQEKSRVIRLRNEWVPMDPRSWNVDMDCTTNVGLGHGSKDQQVMFMQLLLKIQSEIVMLQGGPTGPLVNLETVHATLAKLTTAMGIKNTDAHFLPPPKEGGYQMPAPPPNPEMQKAELQAKSDEQKLMADKEKHQADLEAQKQTNAQQMQFEGAKADQEMELKRQEMALKFELEKVKLQLADKQADQKHQSEQAGFEASNKDAEFNRQMQMIEAQGDGTPENKILAVEEMRKKFGEERGIAEQGLEQGRMVAEQALQAVQQVAQQVAALAQQAQATQQQPAVERKVIEIVPGSIRRNARGDIVGAETVTRAA